jgi:hypothetical protein
LDKRDTQPLKITKNGNLYDTKDKRRERIEEVFTYARDTMRHPNAYHLISHIYDAELFRTTKSNGIIKEFERELKRQYKLLAKKEGKAKAKRPQKCPNTLIVYSIEYKLTSQDEIDGNSDTYKYGYEKTKEKLPFLHIHLHVIADCTDCIAPSFVNYAKNALNELSGLKSSQYLPTQPKKIKNEIGVYEYEKKKIYKKLKTDFDDAVLRAFYLAKIEQKSPEIPYRNTFGTSKIKKLK